MGALMRTLPPLPGRRGVGTGVAPAASECRGLPGA